MPSDPLDERQLRFVYEKRLRVLPTFAAAFTVDLTAARISGINYEKTLHGEQAVTLHNPIPVSGEAEVLSRVVGVWDKGPDRGAVIRDHAEVRLLSEDKPFATVISTGFARADGGFGGPPTGQPAPHQTPERSPDAAITLPTMRNQALMYRMAGDANPLHVDPQTARDAGFAQPILRGLCSFGICQRAVLAAYCDFDAAALQHMEVRFRNVVYPGESLRIDLWRDGHVVSFSATVVERNLLAISNGKALLRTT